MTRWGWVLLLTGCATVGGVVEADEPERAVAGVEDERDEVVETPTLRAGGSAGLLHEALRVLETMRGSTYSHHTHVAHGQYDVDCSGFIDLLLARVDPEGLDELRAATVRRPLAKHFEHYFTENKPGPHLWHRVRRVDALEPGDVLAWLKPDDVHSSNTGHVMLVAGRPQPVDGALWRVPIIDSTASPHGPQDARKAAHATGIGRGEVWLDVDVEGQPVAYYWSNSRHTRRHATRIAMGRLR